MAKSGVGTILGLGVAGVAAYFLYETFFAGPSVPAPAGGITPATTPPAPGATSAGVAYTPPSIGQQLLAAAKGNTLLINSKMNPWQWSYVATNSLGKSIDQAKFGSAFFPSGNPTLSGDQCEVDPPPAGCPQLITADQFASAMGLSGLGVAVRRHPGRAGYVRKVRVA